MNELLNGIPWRAIVPIIALQFVLMIIALVSCSKEENTNAPKWIWILVIIFVNLLYPVLYFVMGRRSE